MSDAKPYKIPKRVVWESWKKVKANRGAAGADEESLKKFEGDLKNNLYKLWNRLSSGSYFPSPVKVVEIPKKAGGVRRLGVPTVSDRIAQTVALMYLEPELEPIFHEDSYGYRPEKSAIQAVGVTRDRCWRYDWVLEYDIRGAFDNIDHELLLRALRKHTDCKWVLLYVERWLTTPFQFADGKQEERAKGTPQGGVVSPLLMNLFMHYVFDYWMARHNPQIPFARYADDGVVHCKTEAEAQQLKDALRKRFEECKLELHPEKTRIVYCRDGNRKARYEHESFDFLGYNFRGRLAKSRIGKYFCSFSPAISKNAVKHLHQTMREWSIPRWTNATLEMLADRANLVLRGWCQYYGHYCIACLLLTPLVGNAVDLPILPQSYIDTVYSEPSGSTITVNAGGDFQAALNSAHLGDIIALQAGASFTGPFTLPNKTSGTGWITPRNQGGSAPWSVTKDITIRYNQFVNLGQGFNISGSDNNHPSQRTERISIHNNVIEVTRLYLANESIANSYLPLTNCLNLTS